MLCRNCNLKKSGQE
ncbi:hypothetical protein [Ruminococcus sp.]